MIGFINRVFFIVFFALGGFLYYIPKWILVGTKGSRQRKKMIKLQEETNRLLAQQAKAQP